jgi:2-keto-4-pentenoate hydratase/2-oxohepta-3-ene-1,7-dioic acid hydratase in catechol pathway
MRLARVGAPGAERPCVLESDDWAVDVSQLVRDFDPEFFSSGGLDFLNSQQSTFETLPRVSLAAERLGSAVIRPSQIICIGLNYRSHADEVGLNAPAEPVVFNKAPNSLSGPCDDLLIPCGSACTDWEVELAVVIGRRARHVGDEEDVLPYIAGYCVANDVSERSYQLEHGGQWVKGKSSETFCPLGPWLVTTDELGDGSNLDLHLDVNGVRMQESTTSNMIFSVAEIIRYLSRFMALDPGDIVLTGTPGGVGHGQEPPRYLREGDVVEVGVSGLGRQRQVCRNAGR